MDKELTIHNEIRRLLIKYHEKTGVMITRISQEWNYVIGVQAVAGTLRIESEVK